MCRLVMSRRVPFPYSSKRRCHRVPNIKLVVRVLEALHDTPKSASTHSNLSQPIGAVTAQRRQVEKGSQTHPPKVPNNLIQRRRKRRVDIKKQTIRLGDLERPPQVRNNSLEPARRADGAALAARGHRRRRPAHGLEPHDDLLLRERRAHLGQRRRRVAREVCQH